MSLAPGQLLIGKYRLQQQITGDDVVARWIATDESFGQRGVVLTIVTGDAGQLVSDARERLARELQVTAALAQAGASAVVQAITVEPLEDGGRMLVSPYMAGGDLAHRIRSAPDGLPVEQAGSLIRAVLDTLRVAHDHPWEIVHRDINPTNILFDDAGNAHLAGFGVAQLAGRSQRSRLQAQPHPGTPAYMAPEQATSTQPVTPAADVYAVGCVLFEALTGRAYNQCTTGTRVAALRPAIPHALDACVARALAADPYARFSDAGEFADALAQIDLSSAAESRANRRPAGRWLAAGLIALVLTAGAVFAWQQSATEVWTKHKIRASGGRKIEKRRVRKPWFWHRT